MNLSLQNPQDPVICPKCRHVRPPDATVPKWQCPACGVAYAKAAGAAAATRQPGPARTSGALAGTTGWPEHAPTPSRSGPRWFAVFLALFMLYAVWVGVNAGLNRAGGPSRGDLRALAATVQPGDVVMYTTESCGYCVLAKRWLTRHGFAFTECDIERSAQCLHEFNQDGADGTPYLKVRGQPMHAGFDADQFMALLRR